MKRSTLNILIVNILITICVWVFYFYLIHNVKTTSASLDDIKHKIAFAMKKDKALKDLRSKIQDTFKEGFDLGTFVIKPEQAADVVQTLESFGPKTGTSILIKSVSSEEATGFPDGVDFLKVESTIEGPKLNVTKAIRLMENLPYNTKINRLSFAKSGDATSTLKWLASVDLVLVKLTEGTATSTPN